VAKSKPPPPDDMYDFTRAVVLKMVHQHKFTWSSHRLEEAIQDLYLAGLQVWAETEDEGLARNRMVTRLPNLLRDFASEDKHRPRSASDFKPIEVPSLEEGKVDKEDWLEQKVAVAGEPGRQALDETDDILSVREILTKLSPQCLKVCQYVMAGKTNAEIAEEMGLSERTVEREREAFRKEYENGYGKPKRFRPKD